MLLLARRICHLTSHQVTWGHIQVTSHDMSVFERGIPYVGAPASRGLVDFLSFLFLFLTRVLPTAS